MQRYWEIFTPALFWGELKFAMLLKSQGPCAELLPILYCHVLILTIQ